MKRQSNTKRPPNYRFFIDRDLGTTFAARLKSAGFNVVAHDDYYKSSQAPADDVWVPEICRKGWFFITGDKRMGRDNRVIDALMLEGGRAFVREGKTPQSEFAELIVRSKVQLFRYIAHQAKRGSGPYFAKIRKSRRNPDKPGSIETWIDKRKWREKIAKRAVVPTR